MGGDVSGSERDRGTPETPASVSDYERLARATLASSTLSYLDGGAADELSVAWNRRAFDHTALIPRVLRGGGDCSTRLTLFGRDHAHPIFVAPVALQKLAHRDGECATAIAADAQGACMTLSCEASVAMEDAAAAGATCRWLQLYFQRSRDATEALIRRAEAAAYEAFVVTIDAPVNGARNRESRTGFAIPAGVAAVNLAGLTQRDAIPLAPGASVVFDGFMRFAPTWDDVAWLRSRTSLPILLKGILAPEDAQLALDAGVDGLVVSNHGGRTLDTAIATLDALPDIAGKIGARIPILLDGGVRRGTDVLKALALGASAVMVGRPIVYGLAVNGALGVAHVLKLLRDEFEIAMALTGCRTLADIEPALCRRLASD